MKYTNLIKDLEQSYIKAIEATSDKDDDGTCNIDCVQVYFPKGTRERTMLDVAHKAGVDGFVRNWLGRGVMYHHLM